MLISTWETLGLEDPSVWHVLTAMLLEGHKVLFEPSSNPDFFKNIHVWDQG